jgi:hypothetical protein
VLEDGVVFSEVEEGSWGEHGLTPLSVHLPNGHQPIRVAERQGANERGVNKTKHDCVEAAPKNKHQHGWQHRTR